MLGTRAVKDTAANTEQVVGIAATQWRAAPEWVHLCVHFNNHVKDRARDHGL